MIGRETRLESKGLDLVIERSQGWFFQDQHAEGFWWGELESNATMDAEYLLLTHFLGARDEQIWRGVAQDIRNYQRDDGSWALYHGAPGDLSTSIECYFALKLAGDEGPHLARAREFILSKGGVSHARVFTRIWLSLFGEFSWDDLPSMPPELVLLPPKAPFSIYQFSSWARGTIVPLLILLKTRPVRAIPASARLTDLHAGAAPQPKPRAATDHLFYGIDAALHLYDKRPVKAVREHAVKVAEQWILERQEADGSWGGIQPPWVYSLMALHSLGYGLDHPVIRKGLAGMHDRWLIRRDDGSMRIQACLSPVWDTGLSLLALLDSGVPREDAHVQNAARWLLKEEIRGPGDWQVQLPGVPPSGWAFEFENDCYPDVDDTAVVMLALHKAGALNPEVRERSLRWVLAMQSKNGGWAAFDKDNTSKLPAMLPFADFGEMIDPPSADVTGHVVELLGALGLNRSHPAVIRALAYLYQQQETEGSWFGRWGVNHVYGTGAVLPGLAALNEPLDGLAVRRSVRWLEEHQNRDGGFGESCASYVEKSQRGRGESTASQTAWGLLALVAARRADSDAARRAAGFLVDTQDSGGSWQETIFTGCGFPGYGIGEERGARIREGAELSAGFMIRYHLYRNCFPLLALGRYRAALSKNLGGSA
jgi:squalene-hopene/tetraprenyl-beta-curcumene cyclase